VALAGLAIEYRATRSLAAWRPVAWRARLTRAETRRLLALGWPPAVQLFFEAGLFNIAALMMGWLGIVALAAHQVALSCAATTFMFPLGISQALSVRIGQVRGAREFSRVRPIGFGGIAAGALIMLGFACVMFVAREPIAGVFIDDPAVVDLAARLLGLAGVFQLFDGTQVTWARRRQGADRDHLHRLLGAGGAGRLDAGFPLSARRGRHLVGTRGRACGLRGASAAAFPASLTRGPRVATLPPTHPSERQTRRAIVAPTTTRKTTRMNPAPRRIARVDPVNAPAMFATPINAPCIHNTSPCQANHASDAKLLVRFIALVCPVACGRVNPSSMT
jgi:hypothetical protein